MAAPDYAAYSPSIVFVDDVGGAGGTSLIAVNLNGLRNDLGTYVQNHIEGVNNHHASNDILDYYNDNVPTVRLNLLETTAYANAAPDAQHLYTQWQRNDMFAKIDKDIIGGAGSTLTQRIIDYFTTLTSGNGSLTTIWNLLHGGSPVFGTVTAIAPDSGHVAGQFKGAAGDPTQFIFTVTNNAGTAKATIDNTGQIVGYGGVAAVAPDTTHPAGIFISIDNVARKIVSLRYFNATENGFLSSDGSASLTTATFSGAVTAQSTLAVTGHVTWNSYVQGVASADPGTGSAGNGYIWFDTGAGIWKARQGAGAAVALVGAASAVGTSGALQYSVGGGIFGSDASNLIYDATNHRIGINLGGVAPAFSVDTIGAVASRGAASGLLAYSRGINTGNYMMWFRDDTAIKLNTFESGGNVWLIDPTTGVMTPFAWTAATPANSWTNAAGRAALSYKKDVNGSVRLRGAVLGTAAVSAIIYTLPPGFIPTATHEFACSYYNGSAFDTCTVYVNTSGQIVTTIGNGVSGAIVSVNDIEFDTL